MRNKPAITVTLVVFSLVACGGSISTTPSAPASNATTTTHEPSTTALATSTTTTPSTTAFVATTTTLESSATGQVPTLGLTPNDFFDTWNDVVGAGMPSLVVTDMARIDGGPIVIQFSHNLLLEATKDATTGQLTEVSVISFRGQREEYDNWQMVAAWVGLIGASNPELGRDVSEEIDQAFESIGLPTGRYTPEGFGGGSYTSEAVIHDVLYDFEESPDEYVLTARPAP